jgi:hypothetical protein
MPKWRNFTQVIKFRYPKRGEPMYRNDPDYGPGYARCYWRRNMSHMNTEDLIADRAGEFSAHPRDINRYQIEGYDPSTTYRATPFTD